MFLQLIHQINVFSYFFISKFNFQIERLQKNATFMRIIELRDTQNQPFKIYFN